MQYVKVLNIGTSQNLLVGRETGQIYSENGRGAWPCLPWTGVALRNCATGPEGLLGGAVGAWEERRSGGTGEGESAGGGARESGRCGGYGCGASSYRCDSIAA